MRVEKCRKLVASTQQDFIKNLTPIGKSTRTRRNIDNAIYKTVGVKVLFIQTWNHVIPAILVAVLVNLCRRN